MNYCNYLSYPRYRLFLWLLVLLSSLGSCGIPDTTALPESPISLDSNSDTDNTLVFQTPNDTKIDRYLIWYKIYPNLSRTVTESLVDTDYDHFDDFSVRSPSEIRKRDFHELRLSTDPDVSYYLQGLAGGVSVEIERHPDDTTNYLTVAGSYHVRRNVAISIVDNDRKGFYGEFELSVDSDIRTRASTNFSGYTTGLEKGFAVAFLAQSAYVDATNLETLSSEVTPLGIIYSSDGFENL